MPTRLDGPFACKGCGKFMIKVASVVPHYRCANKKCPEYDKVVEPEQVEQVRTGAQDG